MHKTHCGHAKASVHFLGSRAYLRGIERFDKTTGETIMNPIRAFRKWRMYNETVRELNKLNSRQLSDLGINRADIERIARQAV
jgi:uncharacterized protein YjiS (DUF1127 family)